MALHKFLFAHVPNVQIFHMLQINIHRTLQQSCVSASCIWEIWQLPRCRIRTLIPVSLRSFMGKNLYNCEVRLITRYIISNYIHCMRFTYNEQVIENGANSTLQMICCAVGNGHTPNRCRKNWFQSTSLAARQVGSRFGLYSIYLLYANECVLHSHYLIICPPTPTRYKAYAYNKIFFFLVEWANVMNASQGLEYWVLLSY